MKLAKIETKLSKILKSVLVKPLQQHVRYANIMFTDNAGESSYDIQSNTLTFRSSDARIFNIVFDAIAHEFSVPVFVNNTAENFHKLYNDMGLKHDLASMARIIKKLKDNPAPEVFDYTDSNGRVFMTDQGGAFQIDHNGFEADSLFWEQFDKWYGKNRKRLFTKQPKPVAVKKNKPVKVKTLKADKPIKAKSDKKAKPAKVKKDKPGAKTATAH